MSEQEHLLLPQHPGNDFISRLKSCRIDIDAGKVFRLGKELGIKRNGRYYITLYLASGSITRARSHIIWWAGMGEWPDTIIDHENRNPSDDRFDNLLPATCSENVLNSDRFDKDKQLCIRSRKPVHINGVELSGGLTVNFK